MLYPKGRADKALPFVSHLLWSMGGVEIRTVSGYSRLKIVEGFFPLWRIMRAVTQKLLMKKLKTITAITLAAAYLAAPLAGFAAEKKDEKAKPYPLDKCIVTDEKLGEMGKPYVFTHE